MRSPASRIADLETRFAPSDTGRVYAVIGGPVGESPADFIRSCGLTLDEGRDMVLHHIPVAASASGPVQVETAWGWVGKQPDGISA